VTPTVTVMVTELVLMDGVLVKPDLMILPVISQMTLFKMSFLMNLVTNNVMLSLSSLNVTILVIN